MISYTREELNVIGACIDSVIKAGGVAAAKQLLPLFEKTEEIAAAIDAEANEVKPEES